jgi:HAD superfamily hydrolase (TIGR01549 family)
VTINKKVILWDFDGVLLDSHAVRDMGFEVVLSDFSKEQVDRLLDFHRENGGLSRYVKFRYFFEAIRGEAITDEAIREWANRFSEIMKKLLINPELLIRDSIEFVKANHQQYRMHIVSGSDENELRYLCNQLGIAHYFHSIHGSPTPKNQIVKELLQTNEYNKDDCMLIGDSHNDFEAAQVNGMEFYGYNNLKLTGLGNYINKFL